MRFTQPIIAGALATILVACASSPPSGRSSSTAASPPSGSDTASATSETGTSVGSAVYPRVIDTANGSLVVHMPQIDSWEDYETMTAWVAVEAKTRDADKVWFGSVKIEASTDIEWSERVVVVHDQTVIDSNVIGDETPPEAIRQLVVEAIPQSPKAVPLDTIIRALPDDFEPKNYRPGPPTVISFEPPQILVRTTPSALMFIDGEPVKAPIGESGLEFVINTNWDLFWHAESERWYVRNQDAWMVSKSLGEPDWQLVTSLPKAFDALPEGENWEEVRKAMPARRPAGPLPEILIAMKPTEIIVIDGEPDLEAIPAAGMTYVTNTESDLFRYQDGWYYLTSGRWFMTTDLQGAWAPVAQLPDNFAYIPETHPRADVLASVPGTDDSRAAVIEAQIPRTATISVDAVPDIEVEYAGTPQFTGIEGTSLERAVNTSYQVIKAGDTYYLCHNAVWFLSDAPMGPWTVATEVPSEIYTIPSSDPYHNTTYVYTMPQTTQSTTSVTYAYGVGYFGSYVGVGVTEQITDNFSVGLYFGTGYYYPPYYGFYPWGYPYYWWYPRSYGYGSWYNPSTGTFGRVGSVYGPYGGARAMSAYNPRTGTYARGWSAWDSDEFYRQGGAYNPRTGTIAAGNMYYDFDENKGWADRYVERGDRWYHGETTYDGNRATTNYETSRGVTGTSERIREDGQITGSGTIQAGDRTGTTQSRIDREGYDARVTGEDGRTVDVSRDWGEQGRDVTISNPDGESISGTTTRGPGDSRRTDFETSRGGEGTTFSSDRGRTTLGRSESGDLYAARNGEVYRRGENGGWSNYDNGSWQSVDRGGVDRSQARSTLSTRDYGNLDRQYRARNTGTRNYNRYNSHRAAGSFNRGGGMRARGRRR